MYIYIHTYNACLSLHFLTLHAFPADCPRSSLSVASWRWVTGRFSYGQKRGSYDSYDGYVIRKNGGFTFFWRI